MFGIGFIKDYEEEIERLQNMVVELLEKLEKCKEDSK